MCVVWGCVWRAPMCLCDGLCVWCLIGLFLLWCLCVLCVCSVCVVWCVCVVCVCGMCVVCVFVCVWCVCLVFGVACV